MLTYNSRQLVRLLRCRCQYYRCQYSRQFSNRKYSSQQYYNAIVVVDRYYLRYFLSLIGLYSSSLITSLRSVTYSSLVTKDNLAISSKRYRYIAQRLRYLITILKEIVTLYEAIYSNNAALTINTEARLVIQCYEGSIQLLKYL